MTDKKIICSQN